MEGSSDSGSMYEGEVTLDNSKEDESIEHMEDILYLFRMRPVEVIQQAVVRALQLCESLS